ncbi:hypothetical protein Avbf_06902 [Armadillidium vulgare]|nr:hypothetical protein Avbf_06902 [Armadillidium vulgare]
MAGLSFGGIVVCIFDHSDAGSHFHFDVCVETHLCLERKIGFEESQLNELCLPSSFESYVAFFSYLIQMIYKEFSPIYEIVKSSILSIIFFF